MYLYKRNQKQKLTFADHVLRGFSGESIQYSTLQILEGKMNSKVAQERPSRMLLDDIKHWTIKHSITMKTSDELQKTDANGEPVQHHVNILFQKTTADDDEMIITDV